MPVTPAAPARSRAGVLMLVAAILAVPRIARLAFPQIWIEDESYLNTAFMVSRGWLPYRDFPLPHLPLLELAMAAVFKVAPVAIRTAEIVSALAALAGSLLVYAIGERIRGRATGIVSALIFGTSSLLFRYHVFEREVFDVVPVLVAVWILSRNDTQGAHAGPPKGGHIGRPLRIGVLLAIAMAIKLTAAAASMAILIQLVIERRRREAAVVAVTAFGLIAVATIVLAAIFRIDFIVQVFAFRAVHASFPSLGVKLDELRYTLDIALAAGLAGVVFIGWTGRVRQWSAPLLQLASGFVLLVFVNPTYWAHTGIELLPWLALCGGALADFTARAGQADLKATKADLKVRTASGRADPIPKADLKVRATGPAAWWTCVGIVVAVLLFVSPIRNLNWEAGDEGAAYGFGYRDRTELATVAAFVRDHTPVDARVATPPIIAFAANRIELVPYPEVAGSIADLSSAVRRDGLLWAIVASPLRHETFWEAVDASRERIAPILDEAVGRKTVAAVINYSSDDMMPITLIDVPQQVLESAGYELAAMTTHYETWTPRR